MENIYGHKKKLDYILEQIDLYTQRTGRCVADIRVLDAGCGNSTAITRHVAAKGYTTVGIDFHTPSIEYARSHNVYPNLSFVNVAIENYTTDYLYDVIICADTLEHLKDPMSTLRKFRALLKTDGIFICSIPNGYGPFEIEKKLLESTGIANIILRAVAFSWRITKYKPPHSEDLPYNNESGHIQFFRLGRFVKLLESAHLKIVGSRNGSVMGAAISNTFLGGSQSFVNWNVDVADRLPMQFVSIWYFTANPISPIGICKNEQA